MIHLTRRAFAAGLLLVSVAAAHAQIEPQRQQHFPPVEAVTAQHGMVVTQEARASRIGADILKRGGNAVDAAVAVGFTMAVTYPRAGNIGGGGFMVIHLAGTKRKRARDIAIDYRETAPAATTRDVFLGPDGKPDPAKSRDQGLAIGVPGTVAGLTLALQKYGSGKFTLAQLMEPAITLARDGYQTGDEISDTARSSMARLARWPSSAKLFLKPDGTMLARGTLFVQSDLAATLDGIARNGPRAFYEGAVADKISAAVREAGGRMTSEDLKNYKAVERPVLRGTYRDLSVVAMPPPSSGGAVLIEMLNVLEGFDLKRNDANSAHLLVETMRYAYADRAKRLGDPDFVKAPLAGLLSKRYAAAIRAKIDRKHATPSDKIKAPNPNTFEGHNTTHFSILDQYGNAVANTYTLNLNYGVGLVAEGTGVLLNNELDDFAAAPGVPNTFGLVGYEANEPGPNKRPLSSMTPTIVLRHGRPLIVAGAPGGSRIITAVLQVLVNAIDHKMPINEAVHAPRLHHQWLPDETMVEADYPEDIARELVARGDTVRVWPPFTAVQAIMVTPKGIVGAADTRTRGALAVGH
ncbi:gamma-glutamyltransferase [Rhodoplanes sp. Z2-YC6860]|uniref:gamma-glutamyltransferase n=1 Tax=Rhodoplanes sp. Z2-YC6860 TaxID=674703 RepID=UPI00078E9D6C|nr:gamma-glutamyltransferase [Rhodoplanes sp. Z2-YC6860]AMN38658.1 gamma-glutamyltranspeptidase [Rhodoplanes sp. Z2-YC6860]